jgi:ribosomal protein S1
MYLEPGQKISTTIISISKESVFLDLNAKSEGILPLSDIQNDDGTLSAQEGDSIDVYFLGTKDGEMVFTTRISGDNADLALLENAYKHGTPVEGHVEKEIKGGFEVTVGSARAFCPFSQMGYREKKEPKEYVECNFGSDKRLSPKEYERELLLLTDNDREYIEGLPWPSGPVYHIKNERMARIADPLHLKILLL